MGSTLLSSACVVLEPYRLDPDVTRCKEALQLEKLDQVDADDTDTDTDTGTADKRRWSRLVR